MLFFLKVLRASTLLRLKNDGSIFIKTQALCIWNEILLFWSQDALTLKLPGHEHGLAVKIILEKTKILLNGIHQISNTFF